MQTDGALEVSRLTHVLCCTGAEFWLQKKGCLEIIAEVSAVLKTVGQLNTQ